MNSRTIIVFDTETTSKYKDQARAVSIAFVELEVPSFQPITSYYSILRPVGFTIPADAQAIHGISTEFADRYGKPAKVVIQHFITRLCQVNEVWGYNVSYDKQIVNNEAAAAGIQTNPWSGVDLIDAMVPLTNICKLPGRRPGEYKWPKLTEAYQHFYKEPLRNAHGAMDDVVGLIGVLKAWNPWETNFQANGVNP